MTLALAAGSGESLPAGGGTAVLVATVVDASGNRLPGVTVTFSTSAGVLWDANVATDAAGQAQTRLTTGRDAIVSATAGGRTAAPLAIRVAPAERLFLSLLTVPAQPRAGATITFILSASTAEPGVSVERYRWNFGDGSGWVETTDDQITHTYREPGLKMITVGVDYSNGYRVAGGRGLSVLPAEGN